MAVPEVQNPNDHRVVTFHNSTDFIFTPEMGCMYDSRAINGRKAMEGVIPGGIDAGESMTLPYHIANQLALNLAKRAMTKLAPLTDPAGIPTGVPLWDEPKLLELKASYLTDMYTEVKPIQLSETDKLMAKVEELRKFIEANVQVKGEAPVVTENPVVTDSPVVQAPKVYHDKQEVIAELEIRGITHDKRQNKETLEKLLA